MPGSFSIIHVAIAAIALAAVLFAEAIYLMVADKSDRRKTINRRVKLQDKKLTQEQVLIQLRKERGENRSFTSRPAEYLRHLRSQSGMVMAFPKYLAITTAVSAGFGMAAVWMGFSYAIGGMIAVAATAYLPIFWLKHLRKRRHKNFGVQLPEALELITRGLKAGHPVPVAIAMVGREMPDPIGTEFGIAADEVTYGSDLVTALTNMYQRVGHEDLPLFVTAVSIQSTSGGNLREILDGLSAVIRERGKLRRKVRSISTEGRMSAYILTALPVLLALGMQVFTPNYYAGALDEPVAWYLIGGALGWLILGNAIMFKMSNFKF